MLLVTPHRLVFKMFENNLSLKLENDMDEPIIFKVAGLVVRSDQPILALSQFLLMQASSNKTQNYPLWSRHLRGQFLVKKFRLLMLPC